MEIIPEQTLEVHFVSQKPYLEVRASMTTQEEIEKLIAILKVTKELLK